MGKKITIFENFFKNNLKVMVGSGGITQKGFIETDVDTHDITRWIDWMLNFRKGSVSVVFAEHVLEHLSLAQNIVTAKLVFKYLKPGGVFRISVPDKNRLDKKYVKSVKPPADGHKSYFNLQILSKTLEDAGFKVIPLEYHDSKGNFHHNNWDSKFGRVRRSFKYDKQKDFWNGKFHYTSLIVDAVKPLNKN